MNFRINLKPFPGAEYFTVREHLRDFPGSTMGGGDYAKEIGLKLGELFKIPKNYVVKIVLSENPFSYLTGHKMFVKDDPGTGVDMLSHISEPERRMALLNLSFSFPQLTGEAEGFNAIFIHPAASLGIPVEFSVVFIRKEDDTPAGLSGNVRISANYQKSMYILNAVLDDYQEKGSGVLLRESNYKAAVLYQLLETVTHLEPFAAKTERSKTMVTAVCEPAFLPQIHKLGYEVESTPKDGKLILTIANYPTHSKEAIEMFADRVAVL